MDINDSIVLKSISEIINTHVELALLELIDIT